MSEAAFDFFATQHLEAQKVAVAPWMSPRVVGTAVRRAFATPGGGVAPLANAAAGGQIGAALGTAGTMAAMPFVGDSHPLGLVPVAATAAGAVPGLVQGALNVPHQLAGLSRHLGK